MLFNAIFSCISYYPYITCRGKWGKVMTWGKVIFGPAGFNIQMTSFEKEQKIGHTAIRHILKWSPLILKEYTYVIEKYCKDKLTISYVFSVHFHKHYANLEKHGHVLRQNGR